MSRRNHSDPTGMPGPARQSPERREKWRRATLANRPWRLSTGPKTEAGKHRSAENGRARQKGELSVRQVRAELAAVMALAQDMSGARDEIEQLLQQARSRRRSR
jgi:hypothetical protein